MKVRLPIAIALVAFHAAAAAQSREFATGLRYYEQAEFGRAAVNFQFLCNAERNAEACYWTGMAYERLADTRVPFGCHTAAKASPYFTKAMALAPGRPEYRDALFDFLLSYADCSRTALWEAAGILSMVPESDPAYLLFRGRLMEAAHWNRSIELRLSNLFLALPRATYRVSAFPGSVLSRSGAGQGPAITPPASRQIAPKHQPRLAEAAPE